MPEKNGARAWLGLGSFGIQPAEFAKIGTGILLARFLSQLNLKQQNIRTVLIANGIILVPMALILLQPDAGTFVVFTSFLFVMYREGVTYDPLGAQGCQLDTWNKSLSKPGLDLTLYRSLFVVVVLSIVTLLFSNSTIELSMFPGEEIPGYYGVLFFITLIILVGFFVMRWIFPKGKEKSCYHCNYRIRIRRRTNLSGQLQLSEISRPPEG